MYWWTQSANPTANAATAMAVVDPDARQRSRPRPKTAPASNVHTTSALALRLQSTAAGVETIVNAAATHAMRAENKRLINRNCNATNNAKHNPVESFN